MAADFSTALPVVTLRRVSHRAALTRLLHSACSSTRQSLEFIGLEVEGPVTVWTDNKAAYDLCHRFTSAQNSRHVDRKLFKMRELRGLGVVDVRHVRTEDNPADIFTKILSRQVFEKHRATILNLDARHAFDRSRQLAAATSANPAPRVSRFRVSEPHG